MDVAAPRTARWFPPIFFALVVLLLFADVLFSNGQAVLGATVSDMAVQFLPWRDFGFTELRHGNLALWNPHIFGGAPFFGGFQSALLYPPNWLHLILPIGHAINWGIALHVFLAGYFTFLWCRVGRGISAPGSILAGVMFMFSGPYFLHLYAGHLPHLCAMVWAPVLFLAIDRWFSSRTLGWCLLGMAAIAMQIFAGHPQYVYYTALAAGIYTLLNATRADRPLGAIAGFTFMYVGGAAIAAVQLLTGIQAAGESWRSGGMPIAIAAQHSLPPENLMTFLSPRVFGDVNVMPYFGRWLLWEMCLFVGVGGIVLALYGATRADKTTRRFSGALVFLLLILALGENTPFFAILYKYLPGFGSFRVTAKFGFLAVLMLASLAGMGFDRLMSEKSSPRRLSIITTSAAILVAAMALVVWQSSDAQGVWGAFIRYVASAQQNPVAALMYENPAGLHRTAMFTARALAWSCGTLLCVAILLWFAPKRSGFLYAIFGITLVELLLFARGYRPVIPVQPSYPESWAKLVTDHPGDYRVLHKGDVYPNLGMSRGTNDVWGYDPSVPKRYTEFIASTQGIRPEDGHQFIRFHEFPPILRMLRCRYVFSSDDERVVQTLPAPLSRFELIDHCMVLSDRDEIFRALTDPSFDPRETVILEKTPSPSPEASATKGSVSIVRDGTDEIEIEADLPVSKILLVTDNYSTGWRAIPLTGSSQSRYEVMPANYTLQAIPLSAGKHHFVLQYSPLAFRAGRWISILTCLGFVGAVARFISCRDGHGSDN